jgi:CheY-like chemotaxis protein
MNDSENTEASSLAEARRPLVLVVDDDDAIREALCDLLEDAGFAAVGARHGLEALNLLAASDAAPAFILLDMMMPVMDGWAFCDSRRKSRTLREIPVIAISAAEISESNRPNGIDAFLAKPIDVNRFASLAVRLTGREKFHTRPIGPLH